MRYAYYPGCSLECNAAAYDHSVREVADLLGIKLQELDDWNCCGATEYFSQDELTACAVIARNLALVDPQIKQLVAPCAACYLNLKKTDRLMADHPEMGEKINQCLAAGGLNYEPGRVDRPPHARRDRRRHRRDGGPRQGRSAAGRAARRAVLRLPGGAADRRRRQHRVSDEDGRPADLAGGRGGRLSGQGPLLRRPHDADQRAAGLRADPPAAAKRRRTTRPT